MILRNWLIGYRIFETEIDRAMVSYLKV